jgi:hypothetical protein
MSERFGDYARARPDHDSMCWAQSGRITFGYLAKSYQQHALSPDPAGVAAVDPTSPQTWNRYAYVMNDPLALVDPLGEDGCSDQNGQEVNVVQELCTGAWSWVSTGYAGISVGPTGDGLGYYGPNGELLSSDSVNELGLNALPGNGCSFGVSAICIGGGLQTHGNWQNGGMGFAGFNMQDIVAGKYSECTGAFHQTTFGKVAQLGSLTALTPLNSDYGANWFETLSFGSLKAAFVGGLRGGSAIVGEAVESVIGVVASPFVLTATAVDTSASAACAGGAVLASVPPGS